MKASEPLPPLNSDDVAEILRAIPSRPAYSDWLEVIFAVAGVLPAGNAAALLADWSPEEKPGEYARKIKTAPPRDPGALVNLAKAHGFNASAFAKRRIEGSTLRPVAPQRRPPSTVAAPPVVKKPPRYIPRAGNAEELATLATLRGLDSIVGLTAMQVAGCLAFTDDLGDVDETGSWRRVPAWLVMDPTGRNISARRLDGLRWKCCGGEKSRCVSGEGSKHWPVGITLAKPGQRLDVVEGEGDFVALWHLHHVAGSRDAAPVGLLGSCAKPEKFAAEIGVQVAGRLVQIFVHRDSNGAGQTAAQRWAASFYRLGAASVRTRNLAPWLNGHGKDLNDAIIANTVRQRPVRQVEGVSAPFAKYIPDRQVATAEVSG